MHCKACQYDECKNCFDKKNYDQRNLPQCCLYLVFSGHGTEEGLTFFDGQLTWSMIFNLIRHKISGMKVLCIDIHLILDSCNSGSVIYHMETKEEKRFRQ